MLPLHIVIEAPNGSRILPKNPPGIMLVVQYLLVQPMSLPKNRARTSHTRDTTVSI